MSPRVVVLDYGSGNVHSAVRMLERVGAEVELTADPAAVLAADGLFVPGVGNFHACMRGLRAVGGPRLIEPAAGRRPPGAGHLRRHAGACSTGRPSPASTGAEPGLGQWPGTVDRLPRRGRAAHGLVRGRRPRRAPGCSPVWSASGSTSSTPTPSQSWDLERRGRLRRRRAQGHLGRARRPFVAAVENGPLWATQFHPEKSGDAGRPADAQLGRVAVTSGAAALPDPRAAPTCPTIRNRKGNDLP